MQQLFSFVRSGGEIAIQILDYNHGGIDDNAEIDGPDRQQVCILAAQNEDDDAEEQSERNIGTDDDGAAKITEKQPLNGENQQNAENEVMQHRTGGNADEDGAVVERNQFYPRRKAS